MKNGKPENSKEAASALMGIMLPMLAIMELYPKDPVALQASWLTSRMMLENLGLWSEPLYQEVLADARKNEAEIDREIGKANQNPDAEVKRHEEGRKEKPETWTFDEKMRPVPPASNAGKAQNRPSGTE